MGSGGEQDGIARALFPLKTINHGGQLGGRHVCPLPCDGGSGGAPWWLGGGGVEVGGGGILQKVDFF